MLRQRPCSSVEGEKMLLWVISTWLFTLYQQIVFRDEWIQCKIYGVFLAWDLMGDKPVSSFYFVLIYFICFTWWIGFCFWKLLKLLKRKSDVRFSLGVSPIQILWFLWISISHGGMKKDGVPVDSVLPHGGNNMHSVRLLLRKTRMLPNSHICYFSSENLQLRRHTKHT